MFDFFRHEDPFLRGNLHAHTTESDGHMAPDELMKAYSDAGYDFLAITDHGRLTCPTCTPPGLTWIPGQECHPGRNGLGEVHHIVALGPQRQIDLDKEATAQDGIDAILAWGGLAVMAHPYWHGCTGAELLDLRGWFALEVYNHVCHNMISKGESAETWDHVLASGRSALGLAVDDVHHGPRDLFGGWVWVKARSNTLEDILEALRAGHYYSSSGPTIEDVHQDGTCLVVRCSPAGSVSLGSRGPTGDRITAEGGKPVTEARLDLRKCHSYVRVVVTDLEGKAAWTNAHFFCDASEGGRE